MVKNKMVSFEFERFVLAVLARGGLRIPDFLVLLAGIVQFFISLFVLTFVVYLAGLIVVGGRRARFSDAFLITILGTFFSSAILLFFPYWFSLLISLIIWLALIKTFYETGWLGAIATAIMVVIVELVIFVLVYLFFKIAIELFSLLWF
ncbi:MAG: hypothetical protein QXN63_00745 [Candidatus Bathyarchaeia archaeon]